MRRAVVQRRGQTLIEFALIVPLLLFLIMNVVNFGAYLYAGITVANAARAGAQYAIPGGAWIGGPVPQSFPYTQIRNLVTRDASALPNQASLVVHVCTKNGSAAAVCAPSAPSTAVPADPEAGLYVLATVDVAYTYQPPIPGFWFLGPKTIHRRAVMRMVQ